jgi:hypothetical protein
MLMVEGLMAALVWLIIGFFVIVSFTPQDKRDGGLMLLLSAVTFGATLYSDDPSIASALRVLLALQAAIAILWFVRMRSARRA